MRAITHIEVYAAKGGRWALHSRVLENERGLAMDTARELSNDTDTPTLVLEERLEMETGNVQVEIIYRSAGATSDILGPASGMDVTSRVIMVALNAFGIGAIVAVVSAVLFSAAQSSSSYGFFLLLVFGVATLGSGLLLFKYYVPMDFILWRRKTPDSQQRTLQALQHGVENPTAESPHSYRKSAYKNEPRPAPPPRSTESNMEQTSFHIGESPQDDDAPPELDNSDAAESTEGTVADDAAAIEDDRLKEPRDRLTAFATNSFAEVLTARPEMQAFERYGVNLYIAGAAIPLAGHYRLDEPAKIKLLQHALEQAGTNSEAAKSFCERLDSAVQRPRYRKLMDAGQAAMTALLNGTKSRQAPLPELIQQWAERTEQTTDTKPVTFLLTDIVGSTAMTSKLGNSGAQKVVRAHNTLVRAATKRHKGTEVKHTGDGLLVTFPNPVAAVRAASEIQQEALAYTLDNPDAPLELRVGLNAGSAGFEDGEYFGEPVLLLGGICDAAKTGHIACSVHIQSKCGGAGFHFTDLGEVAVKGTPQPQHLFDVEWKPKPRAPKDELEYRQIGTQNPPAS